MKFALKNCKLIDVKKGIVIEGVDVYWKKNKIVAIGEHLKLPKGTKVIDCKGKFVTPGLINANTSLGLKELGLGWIGNDLNEVSNNSEIELSVLDGINPLDEGFDLSRSSGITTSHILPGTNRIFAGKTSIIKTDGDVIDKMIIEYDHGLAVSIGEQPKRANKKTKNSPITRMGIASVINRNLSHALYNNDEASNNILNQVLKKKKSVYVRAHRLDDILTAIRIKKKFNIKIIIVHGTESYKVKDLLKKYNIPIIAGPFYISKTREELKNNRPSLVKELDYAGLKYAIATPIDKLLPVEASLAIRAGLSNSKALYAITLGAAEILGISNKVGSVDIGKYANMVIWRGEPLELRSSVVCTINSGKISYKEERIKIHEIN